MRYEKLMTAIVLFAMSAGVSMANLSSRFPGQGYTFGIMSTGATEVVVGTVVSVSYDEDVDASVLSRKKYDLNYIMRFLPRRVLRGSIIPYDYKKDRGEGGAITVQYRDPSPFLFPNDDSVVFRPEVGLTYLLFLTPRMGTNSFDLADSRYGIIPILPSLLRDQAEQKDAWGLLVGTLESSNTPRLFHDPLFDFLIHCDDIQNDKKLELRKLNKEYYKRQLVIIKQILEKQ